MDILAHTLWANYGARTANKIIRRKNETKPKQVPPLNVAWASFWGVFPDLFAFSLPFIITLWSVATRAISLSYLGSHHGPPVGGFDLAATLYQYSHSLVIWALVFTAVWILYKRPRFELFGWLLHILIDIPSHVLTFFPTPFLFPISNYHFPYGIQWSNKWYMIVNYSLLLICSAYFMFSRKKKLEI